MRIEAYNQVAQIYGTRKNSRTTGTQASAMGRDEVQISHYGRDLQVAKQAVRDASDVREDKVAEMKAKISSGSYSVDTGDFADLLLEKFNAAG